MTCKIFSSSTASSRPASRISCAWAGRRKIFNSRNFTLRDSDILHGGIGACGQTFGLLGFWGANGANGDHSGFTFENLFLDNWYSLVQMEQEQPGLHGFTFHNIWALDQPPLADSTLKGDVADVTFDNVKYGQTRATTNADLPCWSLTARSSRSLRRRAARLRRSRSIRRCLRRDRK